MSLAGRGSSQVLRLLVFPVMRCGQIFTDSWPRTLLLDTPRHHPVPILLGIIAPSHQLFTPGLFLLIPVWLINSCSVETCIFDPACLTCSTCFACPASAACLWWSSRLARLTCLECCTFAGWTGLHLLVPTGLLLVDYCSQAHRGSQAHLLVLFALGLLLAQLGLGLLHTQADIAHQCARNGQS